MIGRSVEEDPSLPHWVLFFMLDGTRILSTSPRVATGVSVMVPRLINGKVEVAFLELADRECKALETGSVHIHYIRYFEVHPPTFEGARVH